MAEHGERLKEAIEKSGMRPAALSRKTGISAATISHYLKGDYSPKDDNIKLLADALGVSEAWLAGYDIPQNSETVNSNIGNNNVVVFHRNGERIEKRLTDDQMKMIIAMVEAVHSKE